MSLALNSVYRLLNPLQATARHFMPAQSLQSTLPRSNTPFGGALPTPVTANRPAWPNRPLRVARIMDAGQPQRHSAGRMVISGRMADVCAELDRLVEQEQRLCH